MTATKELRKSLGNFFIGIASFVATAIIAKPLLLEPSTNDGYIYIVAGVVVIICLIFGALLLQTVKSREELIDSTHRSKGKRIFKFHKNTTFSVEEME